MTPFPPRISIPAAAFLLLAALPACRAYAQSARERLDKRLAEEAAPAPANSPRP